MQERCTRKSRNDKIKNTR